MKKINCFCNEDVKIFIKEDGGFLLLSMAAASKYIGENTGEQIQVSLEGDSPVITRCANRSKIETV